MEQFRVTGVLVDGAGEPMVAEVRLLPYGPDPQAEPGGSDVPGEPIHVEVGGDGLLDVRLTAVGPFDQAPAVTSYEVLVPGRDPVPLLAPAPREPGDVHLVDLGAGTHGWRSAPS